MSGGSRKTDTVPSRGRSLSMQQDRAAVGREMRKMRTRAGEVVTVSLAIARSGKRSRVILRFKFGGSTIQRLVGFVAADSREQALEWGWTQIREARIVEKEGWSWVIPVQ